LKWGNAEQVWLKRRGKPYIIPDKFTSKAGPAAVSPKPEWANVPMGTMSVVLLFRDPDVALQKSMNDVTHWMVFNITGPGAGAAGPYHHYTFELFALDTTLELTDAATRADVVKAMDGHIPGKGVLAGRFHQ